VDSSNWVLKFWTAHMEIKIGNLAEGKKLLTEVKSEVDAYPNKSNNNLFDWQIWKALTCEKLGEKEKALEWLKGCEERGFWYGSHDWMMLFPVFESLKNDPEFIGIFQHVQKEKAEIRAKIKELEEKGEFYLRIYCEKFG